ncbi:LacI family DNA-binding transcriptional regulator [Pseudoroseicyclus tamaricis]|uniref:LacI family transcriptional regulator n=1 Tax=Pseudoroseicyclus tamaricis TaxID=2705421 RepID=A0A6B2JRF6_9RHOB|nr:LacI family DNA-binding transcriptional regulator [Pseudoroseicyclus tamaricis]NDV01157.1 LacI family transcriptional regulator [Pseudoroseicyclus tamaricis]
MATLTDVARRAGVSPAAVSRHLNGRITLPPQTRARIDAAVAELNYKPNLLAKRLSTGRTEAIGLVTPEIDNPFFGELAAIIEEAAADAGYAVYITSTRGDLSREITALGRLRERHVDGLILMTNRPDDGALAKALSGLSNVVIVDEDVPGAAQPRIFVENSAGTRLATEHLISLGHRRIAMVGGPPGLMSVTERQAGWEAALAAAGLPPGPRLLGTYTRAHGRAAAEQLLAEGLPDAIVACADDIALGLLEALREAGVSVPGDIALTGFDDMRYAALIDPPLTTVRQPAAQMGRLALAHLLTLLSGGEVAPVTRLPVTLIPRSSTAPSKVPTP